MDTRPFYSWPAAALRCIILASFFVPITAMRARYELLYRELDEVDQ